MAMAVKSELGDAGFDLWDTWSQQGDSYQSADALSVWKSVKTIGKMTIGTLFHEAKSHGWHDDGTHRKPTAEEVSEYRRDATERAAIEEAETSKQRVETAKKAAVIWKSATAAQADHAYLVSKQFSPVATLREIDAGTAAAILGYAPKSDGKKLTGRLLVVPIKAGAALSTLELIDGDGRKTALAGRGTKLGGYWAAQPLPAGDGAGLTLLIGEGVATVLSAKSVTGYLAIAALSAGNLPKVATAMLERFPAAVLILLADLVKATGEPDPHAIEAAHLVGGLLAVPDFGTDRQPGQKDFNDMATLHGPEAVKRAIAGAKAPNEERNQDADAVDPEGLQQAVARLAGLHSLEYEKVREAEASALGVRVVALDKEVGIARKTRQEEGGKAVMFPTVIAWNADVDANMLLKEVHKTVKQFIICESETAITATLWIAFTWLVDVVEVAPLAVITAPEKRCGKSQLLNLIGRLSRRPLVAANISPAATFRVIEAHCPTLLIDEADSFLKDNEELRGVINSGHTRQSAYVIRTVGDDHEPQQFSTWGAKAISGIGHLSETIMDRAVILELRRKLPTESVHRLRHAERGLFVRLASQLARFAEDASAAIKHARPELPHALHDRAQDNWEPLLAIADYAGADWPRVARDAALKLSGSEQEAVSLSAELLADIQEVFEHMCVDRISTKDLIEALIGDELKPWATYYRGKPMTPRQLAKRLGEYHIKPGSIRRGSDTAKGFKRSWFDDAFRRYLYPAPTSEDLSVTTSQTCAYPDTARAAAVPAYKPCDGTRNLSDTPPPLMQEGCDVVTDRTRLSGGNRVEVEI
jgi:putative DNA primase/helicase